MGKDRKLILAENSLKAGEEILFHAKPNKPAMLLRSLHGPVPIIIVIIWLAFDLTGITCLLAFANLPWFALIGIMLFFAVHMTPVWIWLYYFISHFYKAFKLYYVLTNMRIMVYNNHGYDTLYYQNIKSTKMIKALTERLTGTITLHISFDSDDENDMYFETIKNADEAFEIIEKYRPPESKKVDKKKIKKEEYLNKLLSLKEKAKKDGIDLFEDIEE